MQNLAQLKSMLDRGFSAARSRRISMTTRGLPSFWMVIIGRFERLISAILVREWLPIMCEAEGPSPKPADQMPASKENLHVPAWEEW